MVTPIRRAVTAFARSSGVMAVGVVTMNIGTYGFTVLAARLLGPDEYGAIASLMALLLVLSVLQLGIQATAARRIAADPDDVPAIEDTVLGTTWRAAAGLSLIALLASPVISWLLRLDSPWAAVMLALAVLPVTVMGGHAGVLQGERRWLPLSLVYLAVGIPRLVLGSAFLLISPTATSGMAGVLVGAWAPVLVGSLALRGRRHHDTWTAHDHAVRRDVRRETAGSSYALLAFFALANLDVVVARSVLDDREAGLYAAGLIVTKAVLFLPQFAVLILFPAMSTAEENRQAVRQGLALLTGLASACILGTYLLSWLALEFVGGSEYADVEARLWLFAVLGGLLSLLQLLVYAGLAKRGRVTKYLVTAGVAALIAIGATANSITGLAVSVALIDATVVGALLVLQAVRARTGRTTVPA